MSMAMSRMTETRLQMQEHLETGILRFCLVRLEQLAESSPSNQNPD